MYMYKNQHHFWGKINMNIINTSELTSNQFYDAKTLIELCRLADNTKGISFLQGDMNAIDNFPGFFLMYHGNTLVSFLSIFVSNQEECEVYANTLPRYRKQGYFRRLFEMASEQIKNYGIRKVYFVNEPSCLAGSEALRMLGAKLETSEYLMSYNMRIDPKPRRILTLRSTSTENGELLETFRDDVRVGSMNLEIERHIATIYNLEIEPEYRGRGYGVETLLLALEHLKKSGCCKVILHVSSSNKVAYRMYSRHGFVHVEQLDYWLKMI